MNDIFEDIGNLIFNQEPNYLHIYGDHEIYIKRFLSNPTISNANKLFDFIHEIHRKDILHASYMQYLRRYEKAYAQIMPDLRDHFRHSASVYVLGLAIFNSCEQVRAAVHIFRHPSSEEHAQRTSFLFRWSMAASLHDIAYPLELALKSFNEYSNEIHEFDAENRRFISISEDLYQPLDVLPVLDPVLGLDYLKKDTALGLIANCLTSNRAATSPVSYATLLNHFHHDMISNLKVGMIDHGIFSSIIALSIIHRLYKQHPDWDTLDYYYEVVDAATAIFLHHYYKNSMLKDWYGEGIYRYDFPSPLGYLLFFCDTICEWRRYRKEDARLFRLNIRNNTLVFRIHKRFETKIQDTAVLFDNRLPIRINFYT